ncbi:zinc finger, CCHC-type containing protein [Tanacetum coccineum]
MKSHDSSFWKKAVNDEMDSVDLPPGSKAIKSKWIFKRKLRVDGNIEKFKARLVAKGFTQREGLDYFDTYAPVARTTTIRILIALASINKLIIHQMDVKTTFLNGELEEEVYMEQPEEQVQMTKKLSSENFDMKDLGEDDFILGIKILRKENRLMLTQSQYIKKILKRFDSFNFFPVSTPFEVGSKLTYNTSRILAQNKYAKVIGILMYAMTCTRPDIAYAIGRLSYTDASWITNQEDYASMSGWIFTLGGGTVSWGSKKQSCLIDSTMAAEFVALASCCKEA